MEEHLETLVANPGDTLGQMQRRFHGQNCPAVAAAVHLFLNEGDVHLARDNVGGGFECNNALHTRNSISSFVNMVGGGAIGNCAVIGTFGVNTSHYFNIIKLPLGVHYVDAFNRPLIFRLQVGNLVRGFTRFEFFRAFSCDPA